MLRSKTAVVTSGDVNVRLASHLSKVPPIATDAFTKNLIALSSGVTTNTGTCALPSDGRAIDATRQRILENLSIMRSTHLQRHELYTQGESRSILCKGRPTRREFTENERKGRRVYSAR